MPKQLEEAGISEINWLHETGVTMSEPSQRGRPKRDPVLSKEIEVARHFDALQTLKRRFDTDLDRRFPSLNAAQLGDITHTILGVSEEYRLWAELENRLLAVQRSENPAQKLVDSRQSLFYQFQRLEDLYELFIECRQAECELPLPLLKNLVASEVAIKAFITTMSGLSIEAQTVQLLSMVNELKRAAYGPLNAEKERIQQWRNLNRAVLLFIQNGRLNLVYPGRKQNRTGRPSVPLPVQYVRAEQKLLDAYLVLRTLWVKEHRLVLSTAQVWEKHRARLLAKSAGRPARTESEKLRQSLAKKQRELADLLSGEKRRVEVASNTPRRGRKPLSMQEKIGRLKYRISEIESKLQEVV